MKRLLLILILTFNFQSLTKADDIRDFQIEGISVGDSLLDYMSKSEIKKNITDIYSYINEKKFIVSGYRTNNSESNYDTIQVTLKINDDKYIIYGIGGNISGINMTKCYSKQKKIANDISNIFNKFKKSGPFTSKHPADKTGKSKVKQIQFNLSETGDGVLIECYDFSKAVPYPDSFALSVYSKELNNWLQKYQ